MDEKEDLFSSESGEKEREEISEIKYSDNFQNAEITGNENAGKQKRSNVLIVVLLLLIFAVISVLTVYCIYSDVRQGSIIYNKAYNNINTDIELETQNKPEASKDSDYRDENGKYTTEGLAEFIRPQIVEIYTYSSSNPDIMIGSGSGIIITQDGYIVTNTHVLEGSQYSLLDESELEKPDSFIVNTYNDKQFEAEIVGRDAKTDIAVIKIKADNLPAAVLGDSDETVLGERVAAIGNPAGLTGSITDGIVSGLNRKIKADSTGFEMDCIQTNAAISPGNSGGALVNMYGQVIGITSSKYVSSSYEGLGFAITINEAKPVIEELISQGYVSGRIKIGITFYSMDNEYTLSVFKEKYGRKLPEKLNGLWVTDISEDCDVSNTELKTDDFILSINGVEVHNYDELSLILEGKKAGDVLKAKCARIDDELKITYFDIEFKIMEDTSGNY